MLRWALRITLGFIALVIVLIAVGIGLIHTNWGRRQIRNQIQSQLDASFPGAKVKAFEGSVFGVMTVRGIELPGRDGKPLVTIDSVKVELALLALVGKTARIESLAADGVVIYARSQPPAPAKTSPSRPSEPSPWSVLLPRVAVTNARVITESGETIDRVELHAGLALINGVIGGDVTVIGRWRDQAIATSARLRYGETLALPYAFVTVGSGSLAAFGIGVDNRPGLGVDGRVTARVPASLVKTLANVELPGDVMLGGSIRRDGAIDLAGTSGSADVRVVGLADLEHVTGRVLAIASAPDLAAISRGKVHGAGTAVAALTASMDRVTGLVSIVGSIDDVPHAGTVIAIDATRTHAEVVAAGTAIVPDHPPTHRRARPLPRVTSTIHAVATAQLDGHDAEWTLTSSRLLATAISLPGVYGLYDADLVASGPLSPSLDVTVTGTLEARRISYDATRVAHATVKLDARVLPHDSTANVRIAIQRVRQGLVEIPSVTLDARAVVGDVIAIELDRHRVRTLDGKTFTGTGGHVTIDDHTITVADLHTGTGTSQITAGARIARDSEDLSATVSARNVAVSMFEPTLTGTLAGDISVARHGNRWSGGGTLTAASVTVRDQKPGSLERSPIDGKLVIKVANRRVTVDGTATSEAGGATLALDLTGPRDLIDSDAWLLLPRSALNRATIGVHGIDARSFGATGTIDGELTIGARDASGSIKVLGIATDAGALDTELSLAPGTDNTVVAHVSANVASLTSATADATLALPTRPLDPLAWQQLGSDVLRGATIRSSPFAFDPALLARLGVDADLRGNVAASVTIGPRGSTADLDLALTDVRGPQLKTPVAFHLAGHVDGAGMRGQAEATIANVRIALAGNSQLTVDTILAGHAKTTPISATLTIPEIKARELLALFGRNNIRSGTVGGTVTIGGTIAAPTARALLVADKIVLVPIVASKKSPTLERLELDARWANHEAQLELRGSEGKDRLLEISARGSDSLASVVASLQAANFDLAPLTAFAPGALGAARGTLNAALTVKGLDPKTGVVTGRLHISDGRMPLAPTIGTLRKAEIDVTITKRDITATLDGRLGAGSVKGKAIAQLVDGMPTTAKIETLALRKISPIGTIQPVIDGDVTGQFERKGTTWTGKLYWRKGSIYVPPEAGNELLEGGAPSDIIFVDSAPVPTKRRRTQHAPWLVARVDIGTTKIVVEDKDFSFTATASGLLDVKVASSGVAVDGAISTQRGDVDILGRRYLLDHGSVDFDGSLDPRLDIRLIHAFKEATLTVDVVGRSSAPDLRLSSDPARYTPGQLLAFLGGAEPSGAASGGLDQAAVGGGFAFLSSRVGKKVAKYVPFLKFDTLSYEAESASSSRVFKAGRRLGDKSYLVWRLRPEARPDENPGEASIEYYVLPNLMLDSSAGQRGAGADLLWRKRW